MDTNKRLDELQVYMEQKLSVLRSIQWDYENLPQNPMLKPEHNQEKIIKGWVEATEHYLRVIKKAKESNTYSMFYGELTD